MAAMRKLALIWCMLTATTVFAGVQRVYDKQHPLIYEDMWDLWPYSYLNENGEPCGFNIDLIRLMMDELGIPYVIRLKPKAEAFRDLRNGKSDLMLGLAAGYNNEIAKFSSEPVTLFTQSVVTPKSKPIVIKNFRDLGHHRVIVNDSSLSHHLMIDYGWEANAVPVEDMREAIQKVSATEEGQIVWNTLSLKWLMRRYHIENLELTPVNMPHGEYKFMSNDTHLLKQLGQTYSRLYSADRLTPIHNKWFYPEQQKEGIPIWVWYLTAIALVLLTIVASYTVSYRFQAKRLRRDINKRNKRLALIIETSQVRMWTYDVGAQQFTWHNEDGTDAYTYSASEFAHRYSPADFQRLTAALTEVSQSNADKSLTMTMKAKDTEDGDDSIRDFIVTLSVLRRGKDGMPTTIIGTKKDVTTELQRQRLSNERSIRYWAAFNNNLAAILLFDGEGRLQNINPKACELFALKDDEAIARRPIIRELLGLDDGDLQNADDFHATHIIGSSADHRYCELRFRTVTDEQGQRSALFAICRDISAYVASLHRQDEARLQLEKLENINRGYENAINNVLGESNMRLVIYSPDTHTLTVYRRTAEVQHALTQTRCMTLVDDRYQKTAMRTLAEMDQRADHYIETNICTTLRVKGGYRLFLQFCLTPRHDSHNRVTEYIGLCRDMSEMRHIGECIEQQEAKVQEVENTKNSFVKNMVQEIRQPMNTVVDYVAQLDPEAPSAQEFTLSKGIMDNADKLLHLIDNILYLSRLEANMVELKRQPCNFAERFEAYCIDGWMKYQNPLTNYIVENPYERLEVDIDAEHLGHVISQLTANAAQHTESGSVRTRYDYIGRRLIISVDDTGEGIPADELQHINSPESNTTQSMKGLGLSICKELLRQMNGTLEISSEAGSGTTAYVSVPCHASAIKRALRTMAMAALLLLPAGLHAEQLHATYTESRPVTIVCDWDKPPYEFADDQGRPAGSNVDVLQAIMDQLGLPCRFVMKEWSNAIKTFERGDADLILANVNRFREAPYVHTQIINYNRIRVAMTRDTAGIIPISLLEREGVVLKTGDYSAMYFQKSDSSYTARIEFESPKVALTGLLTGDNRYFVWGEEPLKWKLRKLGLKGIYLNDVSIPVSEVHIIGRDQELINQIDDHYSRMKQSGELEQMLNRWFHPERTRRETSPLASYIVLGLAALSFIIIFFNRLAKAHVGNASRSSSELGDMMAKALHMGKFDVMEYDIKRNLVTNSYGHILPDEGVTFEEFAERIHPDQREEFLSKVHQLLSGRLRRFELDKRWNAGPPAQPRWLNFHGHAILELDAEGRPAYIVNAVHDVTQEMAEDRAAREQDRQYEQLVNLPLVAMSFYSRDGWLIGLNDAMKTLCGFHVNPDSERYWKSLNMFDVPLFRQALSLHDNHGLQLCQHMIYPDMGIDQYIECHVTPLLDAEGQIANYIDTAVDLTRERESIACLYRLTRQANAVSQHIELRRRWLSFLLTHSERYICHGDAAKDTLRLFREANVTDHRLHYTDLTPSPFDNLQATRFIAKSPEDTDHVFALTLKPLFNADGQLEGHEGVAADITRLDQARRQLSELTEKANDSGRLKSGFMASMTHELRTPLNAIVGFTGVLEALGRSDERSEYVRIIRNSSDMLQRLINDIIEASDMSEGPTTLRPEPVDFARVFDDICLTLQQRVETALGSKVAFCKDNPLTALPAVIDTGRIQQILTNFVTNAIKFTRQGHIRVGYRLTGDELYIYCEDTGAGVPADKQEAIFERFVKLDEFVQGTGMGLAISKSLAHRLGGTIGVDSRGLEQGSTFWLRLPYKKPS